MDSAQRRVSSRVDRNIVRVIIIGQKRETGAQSFDFLTDPEDVEFLLVDHLVYVPHGDLSKHQLECPKAYKNRGPLALEKNGQHKKSGPISGATIQRGRKAGSQGRLCKVSF